MRLSAGFRGAVQIKFSLGLHHWGCLQREGAGDMDPVGGRRDGDRIQVLSSWFQLEPFPKGGGEGRKSVMQWGGTPSPWVTQAISRGRLLITTFLLVFRGCSGGRARSQSPSSTPRGPGTLCAETAVSYSPSSTGHKMTFTWSQVGGPQFQRHQPLSSDHKCILKTQAQINSQFRHTLSLLTWEKQSMYLCFKNIS